MNILDRVSQNFARIVLKLQIMKDKLIEDDKRKLDFIKSRIKRK